MKSAFSMRDWPCDVLVKNNVIFVSVSCNVLSHLRERANAYIFTQQDQHKTKTSTHTTYNILTGPEAHSVASSVIYFRGD